MILCAGEALIDMLPDPRPEGQEAFIPCPGGAVFNTAIALGRLGAGTGFFSGLSTDLFGRQLETTLKTAGVSTDLCLRSDRPTTLAFVRLVDGQASYTFYDENSAGRMVAEADLPALPERIGTVFFGGISLTVEPCGAAYEALMRAVAAGRVTMIDPNVRPEFITDAAAYRARIDRMTAMADIVKLSDEDLEWLYHNAKVEDVVRGLLDRGPRLVVVTSGAIGATAFTRDHRVSVPAREVEVVDTVGAGDTFNAGLLAGLSERGLLTKAALAGLTADDLRAAMTLGVEAAAVTVSRAGANPPDRADLRG